MANLVTTICSAAALAATLPLADRSWISKLRGFFGKRTRANVAAPPAHEDRAGWHFIHCEDTRTFRNWLGQDAKGLPFAEGEAPSLGSHLLIELFDCDRDSLETEPAVAKAMVEAARDSEATVVANSFHEFKPYGVSGAVIIQESHYTIHTWPEHRYAAVDLFYCGGTIRVEKAIDVLKERFKPGRIKYLVVRRGVEHEVVAG